MKKKQKKKNVFLFLLFITANKVSDYCKLINEEDGHMGDTRVGVCETQKTRRKMGRKVRNAQLNTESARQDDCV